MFPPLFTAGLGWAGLGWAGLGWAGLGWAGLGWAGLGWAGLRVLIKFSRILRCRLVLIFCPRLRYLGCSLALVSSVYFGPKHCYVLRPWQFLDKMSLFIRFFPKSQKTTIFRPKYFDNELKFRPKRDFNKAHVQLVGCH